MYNFPISDCTKYCYETKINKAEHHKKGNVCLWFVVMSSNLQVGSKKAHKSDKKFQKIRETKFLSAIYMCNHFITGNIRETRCRVNEKQQ